MPENQGVVTELPPARHEGKDVSVRAALIGFTLTALTLLAIILLPSWLFPASRTPNTVRPAPSFAAPQLQPSPREDMQSFYAEEMRWLNGTGWVDKSHGIVHIPIEDAMRRISKAGIPDWPTQSGSGAK